MLPDNTVVEREQFFGAADSVILDQLPTSTEEPEGQLTCERPTYHTRKKTPLSPADVRVTIDEDGHAMVKDRRRKRFQGLHAEERVDRSSGTHFKNKRLFRVSLIRKLRWLASSLEGEPKYCSVSLLEGVDASIGELRKLRDHIREAEGKALTTAFYGQPPGVVLR
jgi:hypothetical protein